MSDSTQIRLSKKRRVYTIAEIGGNHEGSYEKALELTYKAIETNVDAIKYQIYTGDTLVNKLEDKERNEHFKRFELSKKEYLDLASKCKKANIDFIASVWDPRKLNEFIPMMPYIKIGSGDMTSLHMIERLIHYEKPLIISTGLSTYDEIEKVVAYIRKKSSYHRAKESIILLQCTAMYPIPDDQTNLAVINRLSKKFDCLSGYSDHTTGIDALKIACGLGSSIIEFHFTDDKENTSFRDHQVSLTCDDVKELHEYIDRIDTLMGSDNKVATEIEKETGHVRSFRRSIYASRLIEKGQRINNEDIISLRPCVDESSMKYENIVGSITKQRINALETVYDKIIQKDKKDE